MRVFLYILFSVSVILTITQKKAYTQDFNESKVFMEFRKAKVEVEPGKIFQNVLILENKSSKTEKFNIFINCPQDWKIIEEDKQQFVLAPNERKLLPIQIASSGQSKGGIGHTVNVLMQDLLGNTIQTTSCLLQIPQKSKIEALVIKDYKYFDLKSKKAKFQLNLKNVGNIDQEINIKLTPGQSIEIPDSDEQFSLLNFTIPPKADSTIDFSVRLKPDIKTDLFSNHSAKLKITSQDTIIEQTVWFYYLDNKYETKISENKRPLIVELIGNNIIGQDTKFWQVRAYGNILFKKQQSLRYNIQNLIQSPNSKKGLWYNSIMYAEYKKANKYLIGIGDYRGNLEQSMYGRGVWTEYNITKRHKIKAVLTKQLQYNSYATGGYYSYQLDKRIKGTLGAAYTDNKYGQRDAKLGFIKLQSYSSKIGNIGLLYAQSISRYYNPDYPEKRYSGYGLNGYYQNEFRHNSINAQFQYGSPYYSGVNKGRLMANVSVFVPYSKKINFNGIYNKQDYRFTQIQNNQINELVYSKNNFAKITTWYSAVKNIQIYGSPIFENKITNAYSAPNTNKDFGTNSASVEIGISFSEKYKLNNISLSAEYGYTFVDKIPEVVYNNNNLKFPFFELRFNIHRKNWNLYTIYQQGPASISEEYSYMLASYPLKTLMIIPTYEKWLYKDKLKLSIRANYINNITIKSSRLNIGTRLDLFTKKGWNIFLDDLFNLAYQSPYLGTPGNFKGAQVTNYLRIGIKKIFNFNQARTKYRDLNIVFYQDVNGDKIYTNNEPGIPNVITSIKRFSENKTYASNNVELLTDFDGIVHLKNIPEGKYELSYIPTTQRKGNYITNRTKKIIDIDNDSTMYIPFTNKNKVYGHVIIKKAKSFSINENPPLDRIAITAISGNNKPIKTLTDKNGYYEMYIPISDYYEIKIENFNPESYEIEQQSYKVKFNEYKTFEINFTFKEIERRIVFEEETSANSLVENDTQISDVKHLQQKNISGKISDITTQKPIQADIKIIDKITEKEIATISSNAREGSYSTTLISGEDIYMKIKASGYWTQKENIITTQFTAFENIEKNIELNPITIGQNIEASDLRFDKGSAKLSNKAKAELENILYKLHENNLVQIEITGHTDQQEVNGKNEKLKLSQQRAEVVKEYLKAGGIQAERITETSGKGDKTSKEIEIDKRSRAANRRVDIKVSNF